MEIGDSPTADTMMHGMPDYSASTGSLGSGVRPAVGAKQMTVTSPPSGWSGTSWTGGLAQGCAPALKISASVNDLPSSGVCYVLLLYTFHVSNNQIMEVLFKKSADLLDFFLKDRKLLTSVVDEKSVQITNTKYTSKKIQLHMYLNAYYADD